MLDTAIVFEFDAGGYDTPESLVSEVVSGARHAIDGSEWMSGRANITAVEAGKDVGYLFGRAGTAFLTGTLGILCRHGNDMDGLSLVSVFARALDGLSSDAQDAGAFLAHSNVRHMPLDEWAGRRA